MHHLRAVSHVSVSTEAPRTFSYHRRSDVWRRRVGLRETSLTKTDDVDVRLHRTSWDDDERSAINYIV